jgi:hypothetical protein
LEASPFFYLKEPTMSGKVFYLRYLPPKENGFGTLISAVGANDMNLEKWRELNPSLFEPLGTYTLMTATNDVLNITTKQKTTPIES